MRERSVDITSFKYFLLGLAPILIWSLVATTVKQVSFLNEGLYVAFYSILFGAIFSFIFTFFKDKKFIQENIKIIRTTPRLWILILFAGLFICSHYFAIYYIFSTDYVVQGNIINYMWPLFSVLLSKLFVKKKNKYSKSSDILFVFMAFIGAVLIISGDALSINFIKNPHMLLVSILSALSAATYFLLSGMIKEYLKGNFIHFALPLLVSVIILLIIFIIYPQVIDIRIEIIILGLCLGLLSIFFANTAWTIVAHTNKNHAFSSIAYLVPVFSTSFILYFNNEPYSNYLFAGLILIVISNILIHFSKEIVHTVNICFAIIILYGGISLLVSPIAEAKTNSFISITATVFTFFAAFLLNRVWQQKKDEELVLSNLFDKIIIFVNTVDINKNEKTHILDDFKNKIIQQSNSFNIQYFISTLYTQYDYKISKSTFSLMKKLYFIKSSVITFPELLILMMLSSISAVYVLLYRDSTVMGDLMSVVFASSISYITYIVYEFDRQGFLNKNKRIALLESISLFNIEKIKNQKMMIPDILSLLLVLCIVILFYFIIAKNII